jgi:hypothetical protein
MALIQLNADFRELVEHIKRIADALDRAIPLQREPSTRKPAVFFNVDPGAIADAEAESDRKREAGTE